MGWRYLVGNVMSCKHKDLSSIFQNPYPENQACWCTLVIQFWKFKNRWIPWVHWSVRLAYLMSLGPDETVFPKTRWAESEEWPDEAIPRQLHTYTHNVSAHPWRWSAYKHTHNTYTPQWEEYLTTQKRLNYRDKCNKDPLLFLLHFPCCIGCRSSEICSEVTKGPGSNFGLVSLLDLDASAKKAALTAKVRRASDLGEEMPQGPQRREWGKAAAAPRGPGHVSHTLWKRRMGFSTHVVCVTWSQSHTGHQLMPAQTHDFRTQASGFP